MGYWFWYPDKVTGEKLMLEVEGETPDDWLSLEEEFTVEFTDATARITGKANRVIWPENGEVGTVSIVVTCTLSSRSHKPLARIAIVSTSFRHA